jgi:bacterioferritin (cytochrome b1)
VKIIVQHTLDACAMKALDDIRTAILNLSSQAHISSTATLKEIKTMSETLSADIATLRGDVDNLTTAVNVAVTRLDSIAQELAAALEAARTNGATPEQLAALESLHSDIAADIGKLNDAVTATTPPADTVPAGAGEDTISGADTPVPADAPTLEGQPGGDMVEPASEPADANPTGEAA